MTITPWDGPSTDTQDPKVHYDTHNDDNDDDYDDDREIMLSLVNVKGAYIQDNIILMENEPFTLGIVPLRALSSLLMRGSYFVLNAIVADR